MEEERIYTVYMHICNKNRKKYIGMTRQNPPKKRWGYNGSYYKNSLCFYSAIQKYGWNNFEHQIVLCNLTKDEAEMFEVEMIRFHKTQDRKYGYNISNGGNSKGKIAESTKQKLRDANLGKRASDETRLKMSRNLKGKTGWAKGIHLSQEHRKKISEGLINKDVKYLFKRVINITTGKIYKSIKEASEKCNVSREGISLVCHGKRNYSKDFVWAFINDNEEIQWPVLTIKKHTRKVKNITTGKIFKSINDANRFYGCKRSHISSVCMGNRKFAIGCEWEYVDN